MVVLIIVTITAFVWFDKCKGDMAVSGAFRRRGAERIVLLQESGTLEANYLKACVIWNFAMQDKRLDVETRRKLLQGSFEMMDKLNRVIPGYRMVKDSFEKMELAVR